MATPSVRRNSNANEQGKTHSVPLTTRRLAAWTAELTLVITSGLVPFSVGTYLNSKGDVNRVPLNPVLVQTERAIARPLALPVSYGARNVAWPTNFLWTLSLLVPLTLSGWQLYLLAKTGSTLPKQWLGIKVVAMNGKPAGLGPILVREGIGRWAVPMSVAYLLWRYSFLFPNLSAFVSLAGVVLLLEATGFPWQQDRRALHDRLAGTFTVDAHKPFTLSTVKDTKRSQSPWTEGDEEAAIASVVITPEEPRQIPNLLQWIQQQHPNQTLLGIAIASVGALFVTLVGTQIYIHSLQNQRGTGQRNSEQFLALVKQLNPNSPATVEERRSAISAMATLNDTQAAQYLVDLLVSETDPILIDTIQQALVGIGPQALPNLKRMNQFLVSELDGSNQSQSPEVRQKQLYANQRAINKVLSAYHGKLEDVDLSNAQLNPSGSGDSSFRLILDKADLWGIKFRGANLSSGTFKGSRFRGLGEDGRWDTYDDWVSDLNQARMTQANLAEANLSRVSMIRADLSRAILNKANLSNARLSGANLSSAQLLGADLRNAVLQNASLTGADLGDAKLNEADMYAARLGRAIAVGAQLSFANLVKTDWQGSDLSGAYLDRANLSDANLSATRLTGAVLNSANLENANLRNADLSLADLRGANLNGADFQGAILSPNKQDPTDQFVQTPSLGTKSAAVDGVDFTHVKNLDPKQIAYICTQGGLHPRCP